MRQALPLHLVREPGQQRKQGWQEEARVVTSSKGKCAACAVELPVERVIMRRPDGSIRFELCSACFGDRFCRACLSYFPSAHACQEHRCIN